jgi:hypothetical protein
MHTCSEHSSKLVTVFNFCSLGWGEEGSSILLNCKREIYREINFVLPGVATPITVGYKPLYPHGFIWATPSEVARPTR